MRNRTNWFGSKDGNCFLYGCAGVVVAGIIGAIMVGVLFKGAFDQFKEQFTSTEAIELPSVDTDEDTISRMDAWRTSAESGEAREPLKLTQDDINVLIQHHPDLEFFAGKVYVTLDGSDVTGDMSFPLDDVPFFEGRYFNGSATFELTLENGRLYLYVSEASVNGESVPDEIMGDMKATNLAEEMNRDPEFQKSLESVDSISIEDGVLTIVPKGGASEAPAEEEAAANEAA